MWFRNLRIYRFATELDAAGLDRLLGKLPLVRCGPLDRQSRGWVYPCIDSEFVHVVNRQWLVALGVEQKLLPTTVVRQEAGERVARIEAEQGRKPGRKELRELRDRVAEELLPRAFSQRRTLWAWVDPVNGWLVIDAGSDARADEFMEIWQKSVADVVVRPLQTQLSPTAAMTEWLAAGEAPAGFTVDRDLELRATGEAQAAIRYVHHALEGEEIRQHIAAGKIASRLALTWNDRVSFVLDEKMRLKRLTFLDILKEEAEQATANADEQFDVDFTLMAGELNRLLADLLAALGGELKPS